IRLTIPMNRIHLPNMSKVTDTVKDNSLKMPKSNFVHIANVSLRLFFNLRSSNPYVAIYH
ncbi:MAG: hypothetical protein KKD38_07675, partial [Candidatus Delongbacteria bacterium]|nr:hypothetical protein [Candidatus Delongbacteria bacterium]